MGEARSRKWSWTAAKRDITIPAHRHDPPISHRSRQSRHDSRIDCGPWAPEPKVRSASISSRKISISTNCRRSMCMTVTIQIPATLRAYCHDSTPELILSAATVRAALEQLQRSHPALYQGVCDETGAVRRHVHLFVNSVFVPDHEGLDAPLEPGDVLSIMPAVSGG